MIGRSRASVSNLLRLLELPAEIRALLDARKLDMGHARVRCCPGRAAVALARETVAKNWSVRELEEAVRRAGTPARSPRRRRRASTPTSPRSNRNFPPSSVHASPSAMDRNGRGKLVIHYHSLDELDGILEKVR